MRLATYRGKPAAIKTLRITDSESSIGSMFYEEIKVLRNIRHSNCVLFIGHSKRLPTLPHAARYSALRETLTPTLVL